MQELGSYLLGLYRLAREAHASEFQASVVRTLRRNLRFDAAFWGNARQPMGPAGMLVPTALHVDGIDPDFVSAWARDCPDDPMMPLLQRTHGAVFDVRVTTFYSHTPELSELGRRHRIQSYSVSSTQGLATGDLQWMSLFRPEPDAVATPAERTWFAAVLPHLSEAWRINQLLHASDAQRCFGPVESRSAVADRQNGRIVKIDPFVNALLAREWCGFDGQRVPSPLQRAWREQPMGFGYHGQALDCVGRCAGELVFLTLRSAEGAARLTPRQHQVAAAWSQGQSHKEVARHLGLSPTTVRNHLSSIYSALDVHSRSALAEWLRLH